MIEKKYNFDIPESELRDDDWQIWEDQPNDDHTWAFIYWCSRHRHKVYVSGNQHSLHVAIKRPYHMSRKDRQREKAQKFLHQFANRSDWLVLDTETTGQDTDNDEILEISILTARGDVLVDQMVRPQVDIDEEASEVHGITWDDVRGKPQISAVRELPFLLTGHPILVYNKDFDIPIIRNSIRNAGDNPMMDNLWDPRCVMKAYTMAEGDWDENYGSYSWVSLEEACEEQGVSTEDVTLHRSLGDTKLTRRLVRSFR